MRGFHVRGVTCAGVSSLARWGLCLAWLGGCASLTPHRTPTEWELASVKAVEIESIAAGLVVGREPSRFAEARSGRHEPPSVTLGLETERAIAANLVEAGPSHAPFPFRRAGEPGASGGTALLEVKVDAVTLAAGAGPDPLTVLWIRFRTRLSLPRAGSSRREGPAWILAADPLPRRLSEWEAEGGAPVGKAVAALAAQAAPRLLADLRAGGDAVAGPVAGPAAPEALSAGADPPAEPGTRIQHQVIARGPGDGAGLKLAAGLGGFAVGSVAGAFYGLGKCADGVHGGGEVGALLVAACAVAAMPIGAFVGTFLGAAKGVELASKHVAKDQAAWRAEVAKRAGALGVAASPAELAAVVEQASRALAEGSGPSEGRAGAIGVLVVRLVEVGGKPPRSELELDLTLLGEGEAGGRERRVCLRGPGPVPTELWLQREQGLLRGAVEAQLAHAVESGLLGLEPRSADGPCGPKQQPAR